MNNVAGKEVSFYRLTELIGKGGFSEVWSAWDTRLNRLVAIKIIPRGPSDAYNTIQFGREATMISRLEHPYILPLYDFGETPEFRFLVMRYVTGGSLAQRLERGRLPLQEVLRLIGPIASTLDYIHEQRVVHRDLKPGNILLDAQGLPYLTDFGLAKQLTDETRPMHSASGTLTYMPPEQFSGGGLSIQSDIYSFGILLYQLFTGDLPYEGKVALGMRQLNKPEELPDVTLADPKLPARLNEYLWQLTAPDPAKRPETALPVVQSISELMRGIASDGTSPVTVPAITEALESGAYRLREAETLLQQDLRPWHDGEFTLSLTHFVLLDILLRDLPLLITSEVRSLMLRGALESGQQVDYWWQECTEEERRRACWHAILKGSDTVCLLALTLAAKTVWTRQTDPETLVEIGKRLMPLSDFTPVALEYLERALPKPGNWISLDNFAQVDENLAALATSTSPLAERAAALIGRARRARAVMRLPTLPGQANPILLVYETAGGLPDSIGGTARLRLLLMLAFRQLTRRPLEALNQYFWTAVGNVLALALIIYVTFRSTEILGSYRINNTLGFGLLFGLLYAVGVWLARHIAQRLRIAPFWLRTALGTVAGGLVLAFDFTLYHQLALNGSEIEPLVAISSGMLYVAGFAVSVGLPLWLQVICGAAGVTAAFLLPWFNYVNYDITPPFIFEAFDVEAATPLAVTLSIAYGLILALGTVASRWRTRLPTLWDRKSVTPDVKASG